MSFADALTATWRRAAVFALVFVVVGYVMDAMTGRNPEWTARAMTIAIATVVYWIISAWMAMRRQS